MLNVVVMCGGSGTRLWPLSREQVPKQFINIFGNEETLFQATCKRAQMLHPEKIIVICNEQHISIAKFQILNLNIPNIEFIVEPYPKNTCAAISSACDVLPDDSNVLVLSSDHIWENEKFSEAIEEGKSLVKDSIVVFGIQPTYPETGYGYINYEGNELIKFVEKPNLELATQYLENGNYMWNSGNFLFSNKMMKQLLYEHANDIIENVKKSINLKINDSYHFNKDQFNETRSESIDYAVMEKINSGKVVKYNGEWSDIGSYNSLYQFYEKNEDGNVVDKNVYIKDTNNCLILGKKIISTIGVSNLAIIDTEDALLVANMDQSQNVKKIVEKLKEEKKIETKFHKKVFRPWGWYMNIDGDDHSGSKVKRICVLPGSRLSLQSHNYRSEHWVITKGKARVQLGKDLLDLNPNQSVFIAKEVLHRMENIGTEEVEFVETQIGEYLGEDDIVRYEDDYGRI